VAPAKTDFEAVFRALCGSQVKFVIVGGVAAILHGAARTTYDVDEEDRNRGAS
jgi:hypothetical protein